jgi:hypothetical protein
MKEELQVILIHRHLKLRNKYGEWDVWKDSSDYMFPT